MTLTAVAIRSPFRLLLLGLVFGVPALARAQALAPRAESPGVNVIAAAGYPAPAVGLRVSLPSTSRVSLDLDLGRLWRSDTGANRLLVGAHASARLDDPKSRRNHGYGLFGVMYVAQPPRKTLVLFPNEPPAYLSSTVSGWMFEAGYGYDRQSRRGIRAGLEIAGGVNGKSGSGAIFVRTILGWSRPARP